MKNIYLFILLSLFFYSGISQSISGVVNDYRKVRSIDTAKGIIRLFDASNCTQYIGHSVMLIQMKGAIIDSNDASTFGNITAIKNAGRFEIGKMCGQLSDSIIFENKLQNFYDTLGFLQVVFMPILTNVNVVGTLSITVESCSGYRWNFSNRSFWHPDIECFHKRR